MSTKHSCLTLITLVLVMAAVSKSSKPFCTGKSSGFYPHPESCKRYYLCVPGKTFRKTCNLGLYYNHKIQNCDWPRNVPCSIGTYPGVTNIPPAPKRFWRSVEKTACHKLVCYYTNWAAKYRDGAGKLLPEDIRENMCTHIIYYSAKLSGGRLAPSAEVDEDKPGTPGMYSRVTALKYKSPNLKVLLSLRAYLGEIVNNTATQMNFIYHGMKYLRDRNFDGLDLMWTRKMGDKKVFADFVIRLKAAFNKEGIRTGRPRLLLIATVSPLKEIIAIAYDVKVLRAQLDFVNVVAYYLAGSWNPYTGHHSPIGRVRFAASYWLASGMNKEKLVIGVPFFGLSFRLASSSNHGMNAPAVGAGKPQPYSNWPGYMTYYEACQFLMDGATSVYDEKQSVTYAYRGDQWVGYESRRSLVVKLAYILRSRFGGIMIYDLAADDITGRLCGEGRFPLLDQVHQACRAMPL